MTIAIDEIRQVPKPYRFTHAEYCRLTDLGVFDRRRVELIDGRLINMPAQGNAHDVAIGLGQAALGSIFSTDYWVRVQMSIDLKPRSAPEPDLAVIHGTPATTHSKPRSALLVVEVSETTLAYDQGRKSRLYARNMIADYWIVNLVNNQLELYRDPVKDGRRPFGFRFASVSTLRPGEWVSPIAKPDARIAVGSLFPLLRKKS
jgi:Uma2 family endonuclease